MQWLDFITISKSEKARLRASAFVEGEDERAIIARSIVRTGCVTKMMIEAREAWTTSQELKEAIVSGGMRSAFTIRAGTGGVDAAIGKTNGTAIGKLEVIFQEATIESEARDFTGVVKTIEFFFLNRKDYAVIIEERDSGTVA